METSAAEPVIVDTDPARLDLPMVHAFLVESYWAEGIPFDVFEQSVRHSLCFGVYAGDRQIGFARVITDHATFAYLADVFIVESDRGRGHADTLMSAILAHPTLQGFRRWLLATRDAHGLYARHGFTPLAIPERWMERRAPDVYAPEQGGQE